MCLGLGLGLELELELEVRLEVNRMKSGMMIGDSFFVCFFF